MYIGLHLYPVSTPKSTGFRDLWGEQDRDECQAVGAVQGLCGCPPQEAWPLWLPAFFLLVIFSCNDLYKSQYLYVCVWFIWNYYVSEDSGKVQLL